MACVIFESFSEKKKNHHDLERENNLQPKMTLAIIYRKDLCEMTNTICVSNMLMNSMGMRKV